MLFYVTESISRMLTALPVIAFVLVGAGLVLAQHSSLTVTGTVSSVKISGLTKYVDDRPIYKNGVRERVETYFEVGVRLTYHNVGEKTLIVPKPAAFLSGVDPILCLDVPAKDARVVRTLDPYIYEDPRRELRNQAQKETLRKSLLEAEPPSNYFEVIEPGGFRELTAYFSVKTGYKVELHKGDGKKILDFETAVAEFPYFKLRFSSDVKDRTEDTEPLRDAQARWQNVGKLLLSSSGGLYLETDVIINR